MDYYPRLRLFLKLLVVLAPQLLLLLILQAVLLIKQYKFYKGRTSQTLTAVGSSVRDLQEILPPM